MKQAWISLLAAATLCGQQAIDWPTGNRTTPPTINAVSPLGVSRGATVEMTVEGFNLAGASAFYFSEPGIKAKILRVKELPDLPDIRLGSNGTLSTVDLGPLPPRNQVTVELDISPDAQIGTVSMRLQTPLGTSPEARFAVEPYYGESPDKEPNDTAENAFESYLPSILVGTISQPGDVDYYRISVKAGEQLVFENGAAMLGTALLPVISIFDEAQSPVREFGADGKTDTVAFGHRFEKGGTYYVRVSDYQQSGGRNHIYRVKTGKFPIALAAFPLGVPRGKSSEVALKGYNLDAPNVRVKGDPSPEDERAQIIRPETKAGHAFNRVKLALGDDPEILSNGKNASVETAQSVALPAIVNGRMLAAENNFRFKARKGERLVFDVGAARLGSPLDSLIEVLDAKGKPVERATVRCLIETNTVLRDHDSIQPGLRLQSPSGFAAGDYAMAGSEILQVEALPRTPDDDFRFVAFGGQRIAQFDTSSEAHAQDQAVYKVQIHPPGAKFASNGLPLVRLTYRNDDGGPGYGRDSRLRFTAPADGEYVLRIRDTRGLAGEDYAYRLSMRPALPDFQLAVTPKNPNVPAGGRIPITVTAQRMDDFDGPIDVSILDLPAGLEATKGVIGEGQVTTTLLLSARENVSLPRAAEFKVEGRAVYGERVMTHRANPEDRLKLISLMPKSDIQMNAETKQVTLQPGGTAEVHVSIKRNNEYGGRVPVEVRNLPPGVRVLDVGLNGVLINETEDRRSFILEALPSAKAIDQPIVVSGNVETRAAGQQSSFAGELIELKVKPKNEVRASSAVTGVDVPSAKK
ncbi:MAG: hypothetical protein EXQ52_12540 [Bryobacterales bacterium]|nr:hypothetical protein [Bryobacterales bacterium]